MRVFRLVRTWLGPRPYWGKGLRVSFPEFDFLNPNIFVPFVAQVRKKL